MKYDVITIGGATEDISFFVNDYLVIDNKENIFNNKLLAFSYGSKINITKTHITFGGGANNVAISLSHFGLKTATMLAVGGDDRSKRIINNLKKHRVETKFIKIIKKDLSSFSFIIIGPNNDHVVFSNRAANSNMIIEKKDLNVLKKSKWVYLCSMSGNWKKDINLIFSLKSIKIFWNPGERQINAGFKVLKNNLKKTDVLMLNKEEAIKLVLSHDDYKEKDYNFLHDDKNLLIILNSWGPKIAIVTSGKNGANAYDGKEFYKQKIIKAKIEDTTGVGDSFGSAFLAGLKYYDYDIKKALLLAARNAAAVVSKQGAQNGLLKKSDI
jgi:sugar/nucleoside kinase (ribokinase family)